MGKAIFLVGIDACFKEYEFGKNVYDQSCALLLRSVYWIGLTEHSVWLCHKRSGMLVNEGGWKISITRVSHFIVRMGVS